MTKQKAFLSMLLFLIFLFSNAALTYAETTNEDKFPPMNLYVGGKLVPLKKELAQIARDHVPLQPVVEGMGDRFELKRYPPEAIIKKANGTEIKIVLGEEWATVNGKKVPLPIDKNIPPSEVHNYKHSLINDVFYVPLSYLTEVLKYPVNKEKTEFEYFVSVGKITSTPMSSQVLTLGSASNDLKANTAWLVNNLGFKQISETAVLYNPTGDTINGADITLWPDEQGQFEEIILFHRWDQNSLEKSKQLLSFYFPTGYTELMNMISKSWGGKNEQFLRKDNTYQFDGRMIVITWEKEDQKIALYVGHKMKITKTQDLKLSPKGTATTNRKNNIAWIVNNLRFKKVSENAAMYNPFNSNTEDALIRVINNPLDPAGDIILHISGWDSYSLVYMGLNGKYEEYVEDNNIKPLIKEILKFYLPMNNQTIFKMLDDGYHDKGDQYLDKVHYMPLDKRKVVLHWNEENQLLIVTISQRGR